MTSSDLEKLTDEELASAAGSGSGSAAEDLLFDRYKDMVRLRARLYYITGADREDVVQEGMIGLVKAVRSFDPSQGVSFKSFAQLCIDRQIFSAVRASLREKHLPLNNAVSLDQPGDPDGTDERPLAESIPAGSSQDPEASLMFSEISSLLSPGSGLFSEFERITLKYLIEGRNYREIADLTGKTPKQIDNAIQRIRAKLKKHLA